MKIKDIQDGTFIVPAISEEPVGGLPAFVILLPAQCPEAAVAAANAINPFLAGTDAQPNFDAFVRNHDTKKK